MVTRKRGRTTDEHLSDIVSDNEPLSEDDIDISSSLAPKRPRFDHATVQESDDDLVEFLHESIMKRDTKAGTQVIKKIAGKSKRSKGDVGGGSFQSMGESTQSVLVYV